MRVVSSLVFLLLVMIITACKITDGQNTTITSEEHYNIVIEDYYNNNKDYFEKYDMFYLDDKTPSREDYFLYSILPMRGEYNFNININWSYLPSNYIKYKNKVFFIMKEGKKRTEPSQELLQYLHSINQLDSTWIKVSLGLIREEDAPIRMIHSDGSIEGVDFVICKDAPNKIRKRVRDAVYREPDDKKFDVCN